MIPLTENFSKTALQTTVRPRGGVERAATTPTPTPATLHPPLSAPCAPPAAATARPDSCCQRSAALEEPSEHSAFMMEARPRCCWPARRVDLLLLLTTAAVLEDPKGQPLPWARRPTAGPLAYVVVLIIVYKAFQHDGDG